MKVRIWQKGSLGEGLPGPGSGEKNEEVREQRLSSHDPQEGAAASAPAVTLAADMRSLLSPHNGTLRSAQVQHRTLGRGRPEGAGDPLYWAAGVSKGPVRGAQNTRGLLPLPGREGSAILHVSVTHASEASLFRICCPAGPTGGGGGRGVPACLC